MDVVKKILAGIVIAISIIGVAICLAGIYFSWSFNTPVTEAIEGVLTGVEKFLMVTDEGLGRIHEGLGEADTAVNTIEGAVVDAGETINETNIAFEILDATVGDTLFPKIENMAATAVSIAEAVVAFNNTLEAANEIPFVDIPTLTPQLEELSTELETIRTDVQETRDELQAIKEENVAKPVNAITERTTRISDGLGEVQTAVADGQTKVNETLDSVGETKAKVARTIDLISITITVLMLWLILAQASLIVQGLGVIRGYDPLDPIKQ